MNKQQKLSLLGAVSAWVLGLSSMQATACDLVDLNYTCSVKDASGISSITPGITVTVTNSGSIEENANEAISLNSNDGIYKVNNDGTISSQSNDAISIFGSDRFELDNNGAISGFAVGVRVNQVGVIFIENDIGSSISGSDATAQGIAITDANLITIINEGKVNGGSGIVLADVANTDELDFEVVIENHEEIKGAAGNAIFATDINGGTKIVNKSNGDIRNTGDGLGNEAIFLMDDGVQSEFDVVEFHNENSAIVLGDGGVFHAKDINVVSIVNAGQMTSDSDGDDSGESSTIRIEKVNAESLTVSVFNDENGKIFSQSNTLDTEAAIFVVDKNKNSDGDSFVLGIQDPNDSNNLLKGNLGKIESETDGVGVRKIEKVLIGNSGFIEANLDETVGDSGSGIRVVEAGEIHIFNEEQGSIISHGDTVADAAIAISFSEIAKIHNEGELIGIKHGILLNTVDTLVEIYNAGIIKSTNAAGTTLAFEGGKEAFVHNDKGGVIEAVSTAINFAFDIDSADTFWNAGSVVGDVNMNGGDDIVRLFTGMSMQGAIGGGNGDDKLFFDQNDEEQGEFNIYDVIEVENVAVVDGIWHLSSVGAPMQTFSLFELGEQDPSGDEANPHLPVLAVAGPGEYNTLMIEADTFQQHENGVLFVQVNGAVEGESDKLKLSDKTFLGGMLAVNLREQLELEPYQEHQYTIVESSEIDDATEFSGLSLDWNLLSMVIKQQLIYDENGGENGDDRVLIKFNRIGYGDIAGLSYQPNDKAWADYNTNIVASDEHFYLDDNNDVKPHEDVETFLRNLDTESNVNAYFDKLRATSGELNDLHNQLVLAPNELMTDIIADQMQTRDFEEPKGWLDLRFGGIDRDAMDEHLSSETDSISVAIGLDVPVSDSLVAGVSLNYHNGEGSASTGGSSNTGSGSMGADSHTVGLAGYAQFDYEPFYLRGMAGYQWTYLTGDRQLTIADTDLRPGLSEQFDSSTDAHAIQLAGEVGLTLEVNDFLVTPYAGLEYVLARTNGFTEDSRSDLALKVDYDDVAQLTTEGGVRIGAELDAGGVKIALNASPYIAWIISGEEREITTHYAVADSTYDANLASHDGRDFQMGLKAGVDASFGELSVGTGFDYAAGSDGSQFTIGLRANLNF